MSLGTYTSKAVVHLIVTINDAPGLAGSKDLIRRLNDYLIANQLCPVSGFSLDSQTLQGYFTASDAAIVESWLASNEVKIVHGPP